MIETQLTQRKSKHVLQKISKVVSVIFFIVAIYSAGYLVLFFDDNDKIMRSFYGAIAFFCFSVGLVLLSIANTNLPDLTIPKDKP